MKNIEEISKFITIEGIDGSGKSSFLPIIAKILEERGETVVNTREPGGTPLGEILREHILNSPMDTTTELLLAFASRNENIKQVIKPALDNGNFVLCDRFTDSTYAYQVSAKNVPFEHAQLLENMVQQTLKPGLTIIFSVPTEVSRQRLNKTEKIPDKFESEDQHFFEKAIEGYENCAARDPERCKIVDSSQTMKRTEEQVIIILNEFFNKLELQEKNKKNYNIKTKEIKKFKIK